MYRFPNVRNLITSSDTRQQHQGSCTAMTQNPVYVFIWYSNRLREVQFSSASSWVGGWIRSGPPIFKPIRVPYEDKYRALRHSCAGTLNNMIISSNRPSASAFVWPLTLLRLDPCLPSLFRRGLVMTLTCDGCWKHSKFRIHEYGNHACLARVLLSLRTGLW